MTRFVALCDVYGKHTESFQAAMQSHLQQPATYVPYPELLHNKDVDAIFIATPDHLHVQMGADALRAGKQVYLEEPTVHHWPDRKILQQAAAQSGTILQCGMQQRSGAHYHQTKQEIVDAGRLGDVVLVRAVWSDFPWQRRDIPPAPKPADLDWNLFLGPASKVPYEYNRYTSWRSFPDYGGGVLADILTHWVDVAQWLLNDNQPQRACSLVGMYVLRQERENPDTVSAIVQYRTWISASSPPFCLSATTVLPCTSKGPRARSTSRVRGTHSPRTVGRPKS